MPDFRQVSQLLDNARRYGARSVFIMAPNPYGETPRQRARFNDAVFYSPERRYLFVANEKAANTTLRQTLQGLEGAGAPAPFYKPLKRWTGPLRQPSDVADFGAVLADEGIFKFCVVRHPYARLVSCFRDKFEPGPRAPGYKQKLRELGLDARREKTSIADFISAIARQDQKDMNPHWRPQYYNAFMDRIQYHEIIRFEVFADKLAMLIRRFYPEAGNDSAISSGNRKETASDALVDEYLTAQIKRRVRDIYAIDFELLGFAP